MLRFVPCIFEFRSIHHISTTEYCVGQRATMMMFSTRHATIGLYGLVLAIIALTNLPSVGSFTSIANLNVLTHHYSPSTAAQSTTSLYVAYRGPASTPGRSSPRNYSGRERSKRQERVGHLVRTELSQILHRGTIKGDVDGDLEDELRQRISVVNADVSPDLRQARISVSIRNDKKTGNVADAAVDKRRAYSWLVRNSKALKHTLAQRMSHMKSCPNLTFNQVDVAAAVDVMYLIDKVSSGYKRESIDEYIARGDFDDEEDDDDDEFGARFADDDDDDDEEYDDDDDWEEEDDGFFGP